MYRYRKNWAASLDGLLELNIFDNYEVTWDDAAWRLPSTVDGPHVLSDDSTTTAGYNITTSEMGHLYYDEFQNAAIMDPSTPEDDHQMKTGIFESLQDGHWLWSGTVFSGSSPVGVTYAWYFGMYNGYQTIQTRDYSGGGLAVRGATVSPVP